MAMSGSFSTSAYSNRTCVFNWNATNNGNRTATINWSITGGGSATGYYNSGPVYAWANSSQILNRTDRFQLWQGTVVGSGSFTIGYNNAGDANFAASVNAAIYSSSINVSSGDVTQYLDNIGYIPPTNVSVAIASSSRTGLAITRTWTNATECNYNIGGQGWQAEGSTLNGIYCNADTISGLQPNKAYTVQIRFRNGTSAWVNSNTVTGTTTGNAPTINSVSLVPSRTSSVLTPNVSYDTNASYSAITVQYGTTTSYGSTSTSSTISGLQPNTKYYYSMTVRDNWNRISSAYTGEFTTTGNVPVINSVTPVLGRTQCELGANIVYDTNASFKSVLIEYGLTTSYGSTSNNFIITELQPNTTYYYRMVVTDNWNRASTAFTSNIKTIANSPIFNTEEIIDVGVESAQLRFMAEPDLNTSIDEYRLYDDNNVLINISTDGLFDIIDLEADTSYSYYCVVYDNIGNNRQSNTLTFTTLTSKFIRKIDENGNITEHNFYSIGEPKNFIRHIKLEVGGIAFAVDRDYATACSYSTSTTSMRSALISVQHTTLRKYKALFIKSDFDWKLQYYDKNKLGVSQKTGVAGEGALIKFTDIDGYYAIEVDTRDVNALKAGTFLWACGSGDLNACMNNTYKIKKRLASTDVVKVKNSIRYIDIGQSGNYVNTGNHIVELEAYDKNGNNVALGKTVTAKLGTSSNLNLITNGNTNSSEYCSIVGNRTIAQVDLGQEYELDYVRLWRYYSDSRYYKETFLYGRNTKKEICYKFHDWKRDGEYQETSSGLYVKTNNAPIDEDIPIINSFTANTTEWTNQGVILTILADDNFGVENLIYSFDGGVNWTKKNQITALRNGTYTAVVKDKAGNVSITNPTITITNIDLIPPTQPYIELKYDDINGELYDGNWTNRPICIDIKTQSSPNKCPNDIEPGYISKDTGEDISDNSKTRVYSKIEFDMENTQIYIGRYGDISKVATIYFYNTDNEYLGYVDMLANIKDNIVNVPEGSHYARIADISSHINNYYMVVEDNEVVPYEPYYVVYDDLSGIKGWYYKTSLNSDDYLPIIPGTIINQSSNFKWYVVTQDNAGNNSVPEDIEIKIDKESPINPRFGYTKTVSSLTVTASGTDEYSGIRGYKFSIDKGQNWTNEQQSNQHTFNGLNGMYNVMIKIIDMAGNEANSNFQTINVGTNTDFPVITGILGNPINWTKEDVELTINATVGSGSPLGTTIVEYSFDNGVTWSSLNKQTFEDNELVHMMVKDSNGKTSETYLSDIIMIDKIPPSLTIPTEEVTISIGVDYDLIRGVTYYDNESGIDEGSLVINPSSTVAFSIGENTITYTISDIVGNSTTKTRIINVEGLVPSDDLYPRDDLYPEDLPY